MTCKQLSWDFLSLLGGNEESWTRNHVQEVPQTANMSLLRLFLLLARFWRGFTIARLAEISVANSRAAYT